MGPLDIALIVFIALVAIVGGMYFLNKWAAKRIGNQQDLIDKNKQVATIYVLDKKKDYAKNVNLPKVVMSTLPKTYKFLKMYFVQAKIGPQIMTFMCEKKVYNVIPLKKNIKVDLAGIYIVSVKGVKSEYEQKEMKKEKERKEKNEKILEKVAARDAAKKEKEKNKKEKTKK